MNKLSGKVWKGIISLLLLIIVMAALTRTLEKSETLADYADKHPEEQAEKEKAEIEVTPIAEKALGESTVYDGTKRMTVANGSVQENTTAESEASFDESVTTLSKLKSQGIADEYEGSSERIVYEEGFYYEPVPKIVQDKMRGLSYPTDIDESKVSFEDLRYLNLQYVDFDGQSTTGEMVVNKAIAEDVIEIFYELYQADYRIESIRLIDEYNADDTESMINNNTSSFCYRTVDDTSSLSNHAYGRAIDLNPFYNPYVVFKTDGDDYISPVGSEIYTDRSDNVDNPYRIDENDLAYKLFKEHGFKWGGNWKSCKDYQHFEKKE